MYRLLNSMEQNKIYLALLSDGQMERFLRQVRVITHVVYAVYPYSAVSTRVEKPRMVSRQSIEILYTLLCDLDVDNFLLCHSFER